MMPNDPPSGWHLARVTIEARSPISCAAGQGGMADNAIARDGSGLPFIPGSTIQGLLRSAYCGSDAAVLFGSLLGSGSNSAAAISFSHAHVHDSKNVAATATGASTDPLLQRLLAEAPLTRDHVRLDHRHAAANTGKFERAAVPSGTRFSFELALFGEEQEGSKLDAIISALINPDFRIGGGGARGYGRIEVVGADRGFFEVAAATAFREFRETPLSNRAGLGTQCALTAAESCVTIAFNLRPLNPWRSGQSGQPVTQATRSSFDDKAGAVDHAPLREPRILWANGEGQWRDPLAAIDRASNPEPERFGYVLGGSALRGPLAHRALYWWNRQNGSLLDDSSDAEQLEEYLANRDQLESLFGASRGDSDSQASLLIFDDIDVAVTRVLDVNHVRIDRVSGGAFAEALFSEEVIESENLACRIHVRPCRKGQDIEGAVRKAFVAALKDLLGGRLAIGAKSYGFCAGEVPSITGNDAATWQVLWEEQPYAAQC